MLSYLKASTPCLTVAAAACLALFAITVPSATAAPATDGQGYVDSTARCTTPDKAAAFGSTATSRVAICESPGGQYEYRGVRIRDGAKLIVPASRSSDGKFAAENDGITYTVTATSLVVSTGSQVIRTESMVDYHGPETPTTPTSSTPTVTATATPTTSTTTASPTSPTPTTPLPPPLPAEQGGTPR
ncbi:MAG: hypothetical protein QOH54_497 [Mycobacterium sp.]|jgi:hypothetical protein|nr:hypothetical protein [Mycobacterium sp.]MDT5293053.1 hypothetical protein [Mycobacterium sp.]